MRTNLIKRSLIALGVLTMGCGIGLNLKPVHADTTNNWEYNVQTNSICRQVLHNGNQIYYTIYPNDPNTNVVQKAIAAWNSLGVINFVQVPWASPLAQVTVITDQNNGTKSTMANTRFDSTYDSSVNAAYMANTQIIIYPYLHHTSKYYQLMAMEHELGHALGFAHDNRKIDGHRLIMNAQDNGIAKPLGAFEAYSLATKYGLSTSNINQNQEPELDDAPK